MKSQSYSPWLHRFSVALACATLFLIFVGGLVTSTDSGLAVPDWPLSYGRLMPPMIGGIFFEHGHRMVAAGVGFLTVLLAILYTWKSPSRFLKTAAWTAVALVIFQGVLGGLTVLFRLPRPISILHACFAQTFFSLVVAISVWSSRFWAKPAQAAETTRSSIPFHHLTLSLFGTAYTQLVLGAVVRHTGWGIHLHIATAVLLATLSFLIFRQSRKEKQPKPIPGFAKVTFFLLVFQIVLGLSTYYLMGYDFLVIPIPFSAIIVITSHVMIGALILGLSVVLALMSLRGKSTSTPPQKPTKLSDYFELTKPGITFTAGITALAGFVLGSKGDIDFLRLIHTGIGTLLISAGAGTLNMLIEKDSDAKMKRTRKRPLPAGRLKSGEALFLGTLLSVVALVYLAWSVNFLTAIVAGFTLSVYLYVYTPLKKVTSLCTFVGAIAGALPPVIGWTAATGGFGLEALVLFGILFFWQFPHFFSLAWLYKDDYKLAGLHMLPRIEDNGTTTAISVFANSIALLAISLLPTFMGITGILYLICAAALGLWLTLASFLFFKDRSVPHARKLFFASLAYVPILVVAMVLPF